MVVRNNSKTMFVSIFLFGIKWFDFARREKLKFEIQQHEDEGSGDHKTDQ